jgi:hypothetical protein
VHKRGLQPSGMLPRDLQPPTNTGQNRTSNRFRTRRHENREERPHNQANFNEFLARPIKRSRSNWPRPCSLPSPRLAPSTPTRRPHRSLTPTRQPSPTKPLQPSLGRSSASLILSPDVLDPLETGIGLQILSNLPTQAALRRLQIAYRIIAITSCEILSKVVTVFESASNARCATIRLENSAEISMFDCSSAPSSTTPLPPVPATPTTA